MRSEEGRIDGLWGSFEKQNSPFCFPCLYFLLSAASRALAYTTLDLGHKLSSVARSGQTAAEASS